jgi:hypothetical protein
MVCAGEYFGAKAEGYGVFEAAGGDACYGGWKAGVRNGYLSVHWPDGAIDYGRYNGLEDEWASRMHVAPSGERTFTEDDALPVPFDGGNAGHIRLLHLAKEAEVPLHTQSTVQSSLAQSCSVSLAGCCQGCQEAGGGAQSRGSGKCCSQM